MKQSESRRPHNRLAASLAAPDTESCLTKLHSLSSRIGIAEIRLDLMESFDLPRLIENSPCPLIITCRPTREGGRFAGSENARLAILKQALDLQCAYVDIEWDSFAKFRDHPRINTRVIVSRHWIHDMPTELLSAYEAIERDADVVKIVGMAQSLNDMFPVFEVLQKAAKPVIAIAMGGKGSLTRLLAPCFDSCFVTFGSQDAANSTALGQFTLGNMVDSYRLHLVTPHTRVNLYLSTSKDPVDMVAARNAYVTGETLHVGVEVTADEAPRFAVGMKAYFPHLTVIIDAS